MAVHVSGTLQVGCSKHTSTHTHTPHSDKRFQLDLHNVTCCQDASWQLSCTEGICREKKKDGNGGIWISWWSQPWIYVSVTEPFMRRQWPLFFRGELLVCHRSCCANISCPGAPAAIVGFSPLLPGFPPCIAIHFICQTHKGRQTHNRATF